MIHSIVRILAGIVVLLAMVIQLDPTPTVSNGAECGPICAWHSIPISYRADGLQMRLEVAKDQSQYSKSILLVLLAFISSLRSEIESRKRGSEPRKYTKVPY